MMILQGHHEQPAAPDHHKPEHHKPAHQRPAHQKQGDKKPAEHKKPADRKPAAHHRPTKPEPKGKKTAGRDEFELIWFDDTEFAPLGKGAHIH